MRVDAGKPNAGKQNWHKPEAGPAEREQRFAPELGEMEESQGEWARRIACAVYWVAVVALALVAAYWIRLRE